MPDITVAGLSKAFGQGRALSGVSFSVRDKEFLTCLLYTSPSPRDS